MGGREVACLVVFAVSRTDTGEVDRERESKVGSAGEESRREGMQQQCQAAGRDAVPGL